MADDRQSIEDSPKMIDDSKKSSSSSSDSDDEISMLKNLSLQGFEAVQEPVTGTGFIYHEKMAKHKCEWDPNYPENPKRLTEPFRRCIELGLVQRCKELPIRYATEDEIIWKHTYDHVQIAQSTANMSLEELMALCEKYDAFFANSITYEASLIAAGSTISMVENILKDNISNGFAMVRPPGHHAMEEEFNGYCTFNNVALAAQYALNCGIERVLIVDWDVHHGQGTQRMFYDDPRVLYFSIHRYEHGKFWPNLRESDYDYIGKGPGEGFNINIPLNKTGMTDSDYMAVFNMILLPVAYEFRPQLVLVSNGLDSAIGDEKGEMLVTPAMYAQMTHQLMALAAGRVCVVLEGGYCIKSLAEGCALTLRSLLRDPCPKLPPFQEPSDSIMTTILNAIKMLKKYWNCFKLYENLEGCQECPFPGVNEMPPVPGVTFSTPENRPEKFAIMNCYPLQDEKVRVYYSDLIDKLITETNLSAAEHRCCYVFDAEMRSHKNLHDKSHPERPERISKIYNTMAEWKLLKKCLTVASRLARKSELLWIHGEEYLNDLVKSQDKGDEELKEFPNEHKYSSVYLHQKSVHCALLSCGSLLNVVEAVLRGKAQSGVAIVRPPGHHAESKKAMGFCFINNVAVAAKFAQVHFGLKRILIVDWDVHHGNATQHQFYHDPSVLYISLHQYNGGNFFPGSSDADFNCVGSGPGEGYNVNIPWSYAKMGDAEYIAAFTQIVMPIAYQFAPELVLVSAGFDCAVGDPLGGYNVTPAGFSHMTHMLMGLANGRVVLSLEGGYNLNSLSYSMAACMATLLGYPCPLLGRLVANERATEIIRNVLRVHQKYWTSLKGFVPVPEVVKVGQDSWAIDRNSRSTKTRSSSSSKSAHADIGRPSIGGAVRKQRKAVITSSSDSSVAVTSSSAMKNTATPEAETQSATETTTTSVTHSSKIVDETEESTTETTTESFRESGSASDRNVSNRNAAEVTNVGSDKLSLQPLAEVPSDFQQPAGPHAGAEAATAGNIARPQADSPATSQDVKQLISGLLDLTIETATRGDADSNAACRLTKDAGRREAQLTQSSTQANEVIPKDASQKQQSFSAPASTSPSFTTTDKAVESKILATDRDTATAGYGGDTGARPKIPVPRETSEVIFRSLIYGDEPDPGPLSIFAGNPLMASQEQQIIDKERRRQQPHGDGIKAHTTEPFTKSASEHAMSGGERRIAGENSAGDTDDHGSNIPGTEGNGAQLGAYGVSSRPNTVDELIRLQGVAQMRAVQPLTWCPHLTEVRPLPDSGINPHAPCATCGDVSENWVCLTCYAVECSRFVNEHMLSHRLESGHNMVLSYSDLSVWCYGCDHYVDNEVLFPVKNAAHEIKFGESLTPSA